MRLLEGLDDPFQVWMSHGDKLSALPSGFFDIGATPSAEHAAIASHDKVMYGIQFHPEVTHTPQGRILLKNFVLNICEAKADWEMGSFVNEAIARIRSEVGEEGHVIGAVSGGVDSSVAAVLLNRAIGKRFHAVLVDNGVLRLNEAKEVMERLGAAGIDLHLADASALFLAKLAGVSDPEKKRKIIGTTFIDVFEEEAKKIEQEVGHVDFLLQGTLYPDVIESTSFRGPSATIKSHHNVGGLKENMKLKLIEPLRELFKDEVRALGAELGLPHDCIWRHPFPGPGLAIRVIGAVDKHDITYFNGVEVGRTGSGFDKLYWETLRSYRIPGNLVKSGINLIAVRCFSFAFGAGFGGKVEDYRLRLADSSEQLDIGGVEWRFNMEYDMGLILQDYYSKEYCGPNQHNTPTVLFEGMIKPLIPYGLRGVLWYQGETNARTVELASKYSRGMKRLIRDWRYRWGESDLPFIMVQLANYRECLGYDESSAWAVLRNEQDIAERETANLFMTTAIDIGEASDIHPQDKRSVGERLASVALREIYGCGSELWSDNAVKRIHPMKKSA